MNKGSKSKEENYRPISLTSILCSLQESCITGQFETHFETNDLVHETQHGFRKQKPCLTNLLDFLDKVIKFSDSTKSVDVIYLNFSGAFNIVSHSILNHKIKNTFMNGNLLK